MPNDELLRKDTEQILTAIGGLVQAVYGLTKAVNELKDELKANAPKHPGQQ